MITEDFMCLTEFFIWTRQRKIENLKTFVTNALAPMMLSPNK